MCAEREYECTMCLQRRRLTIKLLINCRVVWLWVILNTNGS